MDATPRSSNVATDDCLYTYLSTKNYYNVCNPSNIVIPSIDFHALQTGNIDSETIQFLLVDEYG